MDFQKVVRNVRRAGAMSEIHVQLLHPRFAHALYSHTTLQEDFAGGESLCAQDEPYEVMRRHDQEREEARVRRVAKEKRAEDAAKCRAASPSRGAALSKPRPSKLRPNPLRKRR